MVARGSLLPVPGSQEELVSVRSPFRLASQTTPRNERFPELGADTREVLGQLGYSDQEITDLATAGTIGVGTPAVAS